MLIDGSNILIKKYLVLLGALSKWGSVDYKKLRFVGGIITIAFLGIYAAAQFNAESKTLDLY